MRLTFHKYATGRDEFWFFIFMPEVVSAISLLVMSPITQGAFSLLEMMLHGKMLAIRGAKNKIPYLVISSVSISMMNDLRRFKKPSEILLHYKAMFINIPTLVSVRMIGAWYKHISTGVRRPSFISWIRSPLHRFAIAFFATWRPASVIFSNLFAAFHAIYQNWFSGFVHSPKCNISCCTNARRECA